MHTDLDPVTRVAADLAALMGSVRDLAVDPAYAHVLPAFEHCREVVTALLPDDHAALRAPPPRHLTAVPMPRFPGEQ